MVLEKVPFQRYKTDEAKAKENGKVIPVRLNNDELELLKTIKRNIQQPKDSTAIKICYEIGAKVIQQELTGEVLRIVLRNISKNERLGIMFVE